MSPESRRIDEEGLVPGFDSKSFYDIPTLAISRLLEGNVAWDTWRRTLIDRASLSPKERTEYTDRLKEAMGGTSVGNALVDVISNPLVWLTFITTPAGATALRNGTRLFSTSQLGKEFVGWAVHNMPVLRTLEVLGIDASLYGTPVPSLLNQVGLRKRALQAEQGAAIAGPVKRFLEKLGAKHGVKLDTLDPERAPTPAIRAEMERAVRLLAAWDAGFGGGAATVTKAPVRLLEADVFGEKVLMTADDAAKLRERLARVATKSDKSGVDLSDLKRWEADAAGDLKPTSFSDEWKSGLDRKFRDYGTDSPHVAFDKDEVAAVGYSSERRPREALFKGAGDEDVLRPILEREGLWEIATATKRFKDGRLVKLFGDEVHYRETGKFKADPLKVQRYLSDEAIRAERDPLLFEEVLSGSRDIDDTAWFMRGTARGKSFVELFRKGGKLSKDRERFTKEMVDLFEDRYGSVVGADVGGAAGSHPIDFIDSGGVVMDDLVPINMDRARQSQRVREIPTTWHSGDLDLLADDVGLPTTGAFERLKRQDLEAARMMGAGDPSRLSAAIPHRRVRRLDWVRGMNSFGHRTENQLIRSIDSTDTDFYNVFEELKVNPFGKTAAPVRADRAERSLDVTSAERNELPDLATMSEEGFAMTPDLPKPPGGYTVGDFLDMFTKGLRQSPGRESMGEFLEHVAIPRAFGELPMRNMLTMQALVSARRGARMVSGSAFGKTIEGFGETGKGLVDWLKRFGDRPIRSSDATAFLHRTAGLLYASHMGLNVPTLILNLTQPFMNAGSQLGYGNVLASYKDAFAAMNRYTQWRMTTKALRLPIAERRAKIREILDPDDIMGLADDVIDSIDRPFETAARPGILKTVLQDLPLKGFEKTEWLNRLVTYNAVKRLYSQRYGTAWTSGSNEVMRSFRNDVNHVLATTQFTSSPMSTPILMQGGSKLWGDLFANPLMRMFLQFPLRTLTSLGSTSRAMGGGKREILGMELDFAKWGEKFGPAEWIGPGLFDVMRMIGAGAVVYEGGKALGLDLHRGVAPYPYFESAGGRAFTDTKQEVGLIGLPPAIDIPVNMVRALLSDDLALMQNSVSRLVPGGIAINRMLGTMPQLPVVGDVLQKRYADWGAIQPDGTVPIRDVTGRVVEMPSATETILRGIGFDFTKVNGPQELIAHMRTNGERYKETKWRVLRAMRAGNLTEANSIRQDFMNRTGIPVSVSRVDLDRFIQSADQTVPDRMFKTLPRPVKDALTAGSTLPGTESPQLQPLTGF
ncbi:MAG: hypothetical protein ACO395_05115 [Pontimonas sp.]